MRLWRWLDQGRAMLTSRLALQWVCGWIGCYQLELGQRRVTWEDGFLSPTPLSLPQSSWASQRSRSPLPWVSSMPPLSWSQNYARTSWNSRPNNFPSFSCRFQVFFAREGKVAETGAVHTQQEDMPMGEACLENSKLGSLPGNKGL